MTVRTNKTKERTNVRTVHLMPTRVTGAHKLVVTARRREMEEESSPLHEWDKIPGDGTFFLLFSSRRLSRNLVPFPITHQL